MLFFESNPSGRIVNRFTTDTEQLDYNLLMTFQQWFNCVTSVIGALTLIAIVNPWFLVLLPLLAVIYSLVYSTAAGATRDLKRIDSTSNSPIFSHFSETLAGISTIRAFGASRRFERQSAELVRTNCMAQLNMHLTGQWVSLRLDVISHLVTASAIVIPMVLVHAGASVTASPATFGLAIAYSLELAQFLKHLTKMTIDLDAGFSSIERICEYINKVPSETREGSSPPPQWPSAGGIVASDLCVRYRVELPCALKGVSCVIEPRAKVGVVGRTGSGKTTFVSALWRLVEPTRGVDGVGRGALLIDGVDISELSLEDLRSRLAIIPQDPVLFNESLRYNLDPFEQYTDVELAQAIEAAQLTDVIAALEQGLRHPVGEGGGNFSVGQRQLICLARAMLRHSRVVVLDEATASIDNETDAILQRAIREVFADATVLTIAHRLHTIMDSTQVMLFDKGELMEFDAPQRLLENTESRFSKLVDDTGSAAGHLRALAAEADAARRCQ